MKFTFNKWVFSLFSFGTILLAGCSTGLLQSESTTVDVTGRVVDAVTGEGIPGATVRISTQATEQEESGFEPEWEEATTLSDDELTTDLDEAGHFAFNDIVARAIPARLEISFTPASTDETVAAEGKAAVADSYYIYRTTINTRASATEFLPIQHMDLGDLGLVEDGGALTATVFSATGTVSGENIRLGESQGVCLSAGAIREELSFLDLLFQLPSGDRRV
jgi:hypothetical protein